MKLVIGRAQQTWNNYDSVNEPLLCLTENPKSSAFRGHLNERSCNATRMGMLHYDTETTGEMHKLADFTDYKTKTIHIASYVCLHSSS